VDLPLFMVREGLQDLPCYPLPQPYCFRNYRLNEYPLWADIETAAGEFIDTAAARRHFEREFSARENDLTERCVFLEDGEGRSIGTAMAWHADRPLHGNFGRLHWVGIKPDFQGRSLAKPLVYRVLEIMREYHDKAYLISQTSSLRAIKVYLDFGFKPFIEGEEGTRAWKIVARVLGHPVLRRFDCK
jgi:ribosomal protein S18 acetylase RimI-like enzyme